jgi:hypothetical protein
MVCDAKYRRLLRKYKAIVRENKYILQNLAGIIEDPPRREPMLERITTVYESCVETPV